jgi:hypothetical protein
MCERPKALLLPAVMERIELFNAANSAVFSPEAPFHVSIYTINELT